MAEKRAEAMVSVEVPWNHRLCIPARLASQLLPEMLVLKHEYDNAAHVYIDTFAGKPALELFTADEVAKVYAVTKLLEEQKE